MELLTIFTPTYNRGYILSQLYNSLKNQNNFNFEWVIVDDGSVDNTAELVKSWTKENYINIVYVKQENQGKHIAINSGVMIAKGELFFIVDSDDYLTNDAVDKVFEFWNKDRVNNDNISGIIAYRKFHDESVVGTRLPLSVEKCKLWDCVKKYNSVGDKVVIYKTEIFKKYKFPKFDGERFMLESYVYNQIDCKYDMLVLHDSIYYFKYQNDGLSQNFRKLYRNNPRGFLLCFEQALELTTANQSLLKNFKTMAHIVCLRLKLKLKCKMIIRNVNFFSVILGMILYIRIFIFKASDVKPFSYSEDKK